MPTLTRTELDMYRVWEALPVGEYIARFQVQNDGSTNMRLIHKPTRREVYDSHKEIDRRKKDNGA